MIRDDMLRELREVLDESHIDVAWNSDTLLGYLAEGQDRFCEETGYFVDKTNFTVSVVPGQRTYALDDRIIKVKNVFRADGSRLGRYTHHDEFDDQRQMEIRASYSDGRPTAWNVDSETGTLELDFVPIDNEVLTLRVWRYALNDLADVNAEPEIPRRFHRAPIEWAAFKALSHHDLEQQDPVDARKHEASFLDYVRRGRRAFIRMRASDNYVAPSSEYVV